MCGPELTLSTVIMLNTCITWIFTHEYAVIFYKFLQMFFILEKVSKNI